MSDFSELHPCLYKCVLSCKNPVHIYWYFSEDQPGLILISNLGSLHWRTLFSPVGGALYCVSPDLRILFSLNRNRHLVSEIIRYIWWKNTQVWLVSPLVSSTFGWVLIKKEFEVLKMIDNYPGHGSLSLHFRHTDVRGVSFSETFMGRFPCSFWRSWSL